jgi:hypothetical protein
VDLVGARASFLTAGPAPAAGAVHGGEAMGATRTWRIAAVLLGAVVLGLGCGPMQLPYFLLQGESTAPPGLKKIAADGKEVTVAVLVSGGLETRPEFRSADRALTQRIVKKMGEAFKESKEKVKVVSATKIDAFKNTHPNWRTMEKDEIGRMLDADCVVYVEINELSMYKKGSANMLYQGQALLTINLIDVNNPDEPPETKELTITHPGETLDSIPVDDKSPGAFLAEFYDKAAAQVAWQFTAHSTAEDFPCN